MKCSTGKIRYADILKALSCLDQIQKKPGREEKNVYPCEECKGWHITKQLTKYQTIDILSKFQRRLTMKISQHNDSTSLIFTQTVCSFPNVLVPKLNTLSGNMEYSIDLLIPKGEVDRTEFDKAIAQAKEDKFGANVPDFKYEFLKDGDKNIDKKTGEVRGGYEGVWYIGAKTQENDPPAAVNRMKENLTGQGSDNTIVGGDIVNCFVIAFGYSRGGNSGISFDLKSVMLRDKADKPFGGGVSGKAATSAFDQYDPDDEMGI